MEPLKNDTVIGKLAQTYQQLYLNPDTEKIEAYKEVMLKGKEPETKDLSWFVCDSRDKAEWIETPVGKVNVVTIYNRNDFELMIRSLMAAKEGPEKPVPKTQGASMLTVFNWPRINAHKQEFFKQAIDQGDLFPDWGAELKRFTSVKDNYLDRLIVLSIGPYSGLPAEEAGLTEEEWIERSDTIRKYHEITHVICRINYPDRVNAVWDELTADAIGIYAAYGKYDAELEKKFLGIRGEEYIGGRLENYTEDPKGICGKVCAAIEGQDRLIREHSDLAPFALIDILEESQVMKDFVTAER